MLEITIHLCVHNVHLNIQTKYGSTALMNAARYGHQKCFDILIQGGADVNIQDKYGFTALIEAATEDRDKCVETLIQGGADVNIQSNSGETVLMCAAVLVRDECVDILIQGGADVNIQSNSGNTALMFAAVLARDECVDILIQGGADVNIQSNSGNTALMFAAVLARDECVDILIQGGADVNTQSNGGHTALMFAASHYYFNKRTELLIQAGAEVLNTYGQIVPEQEEVRKFLFAAGQAVPDADKYTETESELNLSHLCRVSIRKHLLQMSDMNLFARVPKLGLPKPLMKYLLFTEILEDGDALPDFTAAMKHLLQMWSVNLFTKLVCRKF